jgi:hypothetical protein
MDYPFIYKSGGVKEGDSNRGDDFKLYKLVWVPIEKENKTK